MTVYNADVVHKMRTVIALGSNIGDRIRWLQCGVDRLRSQPDTTPVMVSRIYESKPEGEGLEGDFLNCALAVDTHLPPASLLIVCKEVEKLCGRDTSSGHGSRNRTLDLDIVFYGDDCIDEPGLRIPHPRWRERSFVVLPLLDLRDHLTAWQKRLLDEAAEDISSETESCRLTEHVLKYD